jgi:hypothetical protein
MSVENLDLEINCSLIKRGKRLGKFFEKKFARSGQQAERANSNI